jgi:hypothetical protein
MTADPDAPDEYTHSMCGVYAQLIRDEAKSDNPDTDAIVHLTQLIEKYCQTVAFEPGEVPEHLEDDLFTGEVATD